MLLCIRHFPVSVADEYFGVRKAWHILVLTIESITDVRGKSSLSILWKIAVAERDGRRNVESAQ